MSVSDFSPSLMLAGMDYIAPSEACVLPTQLQSAKGPSGGVQRHPSDGAVVKITLQDCLACSGCVTTAEAILVSSQSREEVLKARANDLDRPFLVTISDQSAASLAAYLKTSVAEAFRIVSGFFRFALHAKYVADLRWAQNVSAEKTAEEYCRRLRCEREALPMIVSACPGWVCYCEKQGGAILPLLCPVMSPQGIAGSYAKKRLPGVCHVSVQPCFDRKLEAARDAAPSSGERYTDFVLSTQEVLVWMLEADPAVPWRGPMDSDWNPRPAAPRDAANREVAAAMEGSGGFHRHAMIYAAQEMHQSILAVDDIRYEVKRNPNHQVATSPSNSGEVFCVAYGFQHIQNIVRGLKRKLASVASYTFIEMMACPEGCLNGGGQIRQSNLMDQIKTIAEVKSVFACEAFPVEECDEESGSHAGPEMKGKIRKTEVERLLVGAGEAADNVPLFFSFDAFCELEKTYGASLWNCVFHDRQKEYEATLDNGGVHSLKW